MPQFPGRKGSSTVGSAAGLGREGPDVLPKLTSFDGLRRMSPTPPPFLRPWFRTVTMHMSSVSQARSHWSASASRIPEGGQGGNKSKKSTHRAKVQLQRIPSYRMRCSVPSGSRCSVWISQPAAPPACFLQWRCLAERSQSSHFLYD